MPSFIAALLGGLINISGYLAGRVLIALGFSSVTYTGFSTSLDWLKGQAVTNLNGLPVDVVSMMSYMKVGVAVSIIVSAMLARMLLDGLSAGGSISKLVRR